MSTDDDDANVRAFERVLVKLRPGHTYRMNERGIREEVHDDKPTHWICRRVEDYPPNGIPAAAAFAYCSRCAARIAFNPARTVDAPKVCMQCADIEPLPMGGES